MFAIRFVMVGIGLVLLAAGGAAIAAAPYAAAWGKDRLAAGIGAALGAPASIGAIEIDPWSRAVLVREVAVANPAPFGPGQALGCGTVRIELNPLSLFSDAPAVGRIVVDGVRLGPRWDPVHGGNLAALARAAQPVPPAAGAQVSPTPRVRVGELHCTGVALAPQQPGTGVPGPIQLPAFTVEDLGGTGALRGSELLAGILEALLRRMPGGPAAVSGKTAEIVGLTPKE